MHEFKNRLIAIILIITTTVISTNLIEGEFRFLLFFTLVVIFLLASTLFFEKNISLIKVLVLSLFVRITLIIINTFIYTLPSNSKDAVRFERVAYELSQNLLHGNYSDIHWEGSYLFSQIISYFYLIFGRYELIPQLLNTVLFLISTIYIYKISCKLTDKNVAIKVALIFSLLPTQLVFSVSILRESFILLFFVLYCFYSMEWLEKKKRAHLVISLIFLIISTLFHSGMIIVVLTLPIIYLIKSKQNIFIKVTFIILMLILGFILLNNLGLSKLSGDDGGLSFDKIASYNDEIIDSRTVYLQSLPKDNFVISLFLFPVYLFFFLFKPFIWEVRTAGDLLGLFDSVSIFIFSWLSVKIVSENKLFLFLILVFLIGTMAFAWGTNNYGTALRHRSKFSWIVLILAGAYLNSKGSKNSPTNRII